MNQLAWLTRAARWARRPPSAPRVLLVSGIVAACLALAGIERLGLWPEAFHVNGRIKGSHFRP